MVCNKNHVKIINRDNKTNVSIKSYYDLPGPPGKDGKSAYEIWLEEGYVGTKEDFLASLHEESEATDLLALYILEKG